MEARTTASTRNATIRAVIKRADGRIEDLGVIAGGMIDEQGKITERVGLLTRMRRWCRIQAANLRMRLG
jgi:hypothetical protein